LKHVFFQFFISNLKKPFFIFLFPPNFKLNLFI